MITVYCTCNDCNFEWELDVFSKSELPDECPQCESSDISIEDDWGNDY